MGLQVSSPFISLGLNDGATEQEVRAAYRRMAQQLHPDKGGSVEEFQQLKDVYQKALRLALKSKVCQTCDGAGKICIYHGFHSTKSRCPDCKGVR